MCPRAFALALHAPDFVLICERCKLQAQGQGRMRTSAYVQLPSISCRVEPDSFVLPFYAPSSVAYRGLLPGQGSVHVNLTPHSLTQRDTLVW